MLNRKFLLLIALVFLFSLTSVSYSQSKKGKRKSKTYITQYEYGKTYKTTSYAKVKRNENAKKKFLKSMGYKRVPNGYQVDHIRPLSEGGSDTPDNMQLITKESHKYKTAQEKHRHKKTSSKKTYKKKKR
ncbi:MAG TPA: HNH endonuclease signature motif containing protein [Ignavibacteria bacterium]